MVKVEVYGTKYCPYCVRARHLLESKGVDYLWIDVSANGEARQEMMTRSNGVTVPQIFIDERPIGGCDDLFALDREGRLNNMLGLE
jgi:glutaredoxin 3